MEELEKALQNIEDEKEIIDEIESTTDAYIVRSQISTCNICKQKKDLRMGVCFSCSDFAMCVELESGDTKVWDERNPDNFWILKGK